MKVEAINRSKGTVERVQARITNADFDDLAHYICQQFIDRKERRREHEQHWDEIERQLAMKPDTSYKRDESGKLRRGWEWLPEIELPLQAEALEILSADVRRLRFPTSGTWFRAHSLLSDDYLERSDLKSIIAGDRNDVPTQMDQDLADRLSEGIHHHWHSQYDFQGNWSIADTEALRYGMGVIRGRVARRNIFMHSERGVVRRSERIPIAMPKSIRNVYPDDTPHAVYREGLHVGSGVIAVWQQRLADLVMAANKMPNDPDKPNGGWMPSMLRNMDADDNGNVSVIEWEGDIVFPRKTVDDLFVPNVIVTAIMGKHSGKATAKIIRLRYKKESTSSYTFIPYHQEGIEPFYPTSPLMKGRPIQAAAVHMIVRVLAAAALNAQPPVRYDKDDQELAASGGVDMSPAALIGTLGEIAPLQVGDPGGLMVVYQHFLQQYSEVTGIMAARMGQQTVSHTTAFAKEAELVRSESRTVDFANSTNYSALNRWLTWEYEVGLREMSGSQMFYVPQYGSYVEITKEQLPDVVQYDVHGAGGPAEMREKQERKLAALNFALQLEQVGAQFGRQPSIDMDAAIREILGDGGWTDVDVILSGEGTAAGAGQLPGVAGDQGLAGGAAAAALQAVE